MHPDLMKALELVTKHAGRAHAEKVFGHLLGTPTPEKTLDENVKTEVLDHNVITGEPSMHLEPDGDEDQYGNEPPGDEEGGEPADEHMKDHPMHLGIATTTTRIPQIMEGPAKPMHGIQETAKKRRGRPRKVSE